MYRVIVVDDEVWALKGIQRLMQNRAEQFQIIFETTDPVEALERICEDQPDIVFTDVRMPEISGIELMHKVRERGIETSFVVISGFADFSYVQQALQEGAVDYQVKPMDIQKADAMLERVYTKLENKRSIDELNFYASLREGRRNIGILLQPKMKQPLYKRYQVVTVRFKTSDFDMNILDLGSKIQLIRLKLGPRKCIYIINSENDKTECISSILAAKSDEISSVGISQCIENIDKMSMLLKNSELASRDCFTNSTKLISRYKPANIAMVTRLWQKISEALENHEYNYLRNIISEIPEYFLTHELTAEDAVALWNQIVISIPEHIEDKETLLDFEHLDMEGLTEKFADLAAMSEYLFERLPFQESVQGKTVNHQFNQLLDFIEHHYTEELYLKELCTRFFINMSYCCELFRKAKNMTFSQYITSLRIRNACELLQSPQISIQEICERVGYNDYFYFNKVFKRNIGCTPFEYRRSKERRGIDALD